MPEGGGGWVHGCRQAGGCADVPGRGDAGCKATGKQVGVLGGIRKTARCRCAGCSSLLEIKYSCSFLQAEQAGADAAQAQVQTKQAQEAAAAAARMRKLLDKRMTALRAKAQAAAQVGLVHACMSCGMHESHTGMHVISSIL